MKQVNLVFHHLKLDQDLLSLVSSGRIQLKSDR